MKLKLEYQGECDNPEVAEKKNKILEEFFNFLNSFEYNSMDSHKMWWDGMFEELKELEKLIKKVWKSNKARAKLNLSQLTAKRNKLNREISTLKKATLNKKHLCISCKFSPASYDEFEDTYGLCEECQAEDNRDMAIEASHEPPD